MARVKPMEYGFRRVGAASCRLVIPESLPEHMQKQVVEIIELFVSKDVRGQGYGRTLMHSICRDADNVNVTLFLKVKPYDSDMGLEELTDWYGMKFGFVVIQAEPRLMARMPGSTPRVGLPAVTLVANAARMTK